MSLLHLVVMCARGVEPFPRLGRWDFMTNFINRIQTIACVALFAGAFALNGCGNGQPSTTSLHDAAKMNDPAAIKAALAKSPGGVDSRNSRNETALIAGAKVHALDGMQFLLDNGANINAQDSNNYT